jgi:hypothetical protein
VELLSLRFYVIEKEFLLLCVIIVIIEYFCFLPATLFGELGHYVSIFKTNHDFVGKLIVTYELYIRFMSVV